MISTKTSNQNTVQLGIVLVFNESANFKRALYTNLRLKLEENYAGWAKVSLGTKGIFGCSQ